MHCREQVYLLDVQIHDINFDNVKELSYVDDRQDFKILAHFLGYDPVLIHDNNESGFKATPILFKMNPEELVKAMDRNPLTLSVLGKLDENRDYTIGTIKVLFTEDFADTVIFAKSSDMYPVTSQMDGPFSFRNLYHEDSGYVYVYLKLSCFGSIDLKTKCNYDKVDGYKEPNMIEESPETKENQFTPTITDKKAMISAVPFLEKSDEPNLSLPVPWSMSKNGFNPIYEPTPRSPQKRTNETSYDNTHKTEEVTSECTCGNVPQFLTQKPHTITLKCQCAEILAAMKSCFPNHIPEMMQSKSQTAPAPVAPTTNQPTQATKQSAVPVEKKPETDVGQRPIPTTSTKPPSQAQSTAQKVTSKDIIPTSEVCSPDKKISGTMFKSASEENTKMRKSDVKSAVSNIDLSSPEVVKQEDSSKRVASNNQLNLEKKKEIIKKTLKSTKSKNKKDIYEYTAGMYPGMVIGHKYCVPAVRLVPRNMGWMWNLLNLFGSAKHSKGWRPGAIVKTVAKNFGSWNKAAGFQSGDDVESFLNFKRKKAKEGETVVPHTIKPTLHVHKKDKFYHITVNPPGDSNVKPLSFKVDPRKGSSDEETSCESTTDDSFEFEYTVPAGLLPPPKKIEFTTATTQYQVTDFQPRRKVEVTAQAEESTTEKKQNETKKPTTTGPKKKGKKSK